MKKKIEAPKEEGIISIVQSPEESDNKTDKEKKIAKENDAEKDKGIISVIQTPEEDQKRKIIGN